MKSHFLGSFALIFYILPVVFAIIVIPVLRRRMRVISQLLNQQAVKRNGTVKYMLGIPYYLYYDLYGNTVTVSMTHGRKNHPPQTVFSVDTQKQESLKMSIVPEGVVARIGKKFGAQDIQINNTAFDQSFLIKGNPESRVRSFLCEETQELIQSWKARFPYTIIKESKFEFKVLTLLNTDKDVCKFIDAGEKLFRRYQQTH